MPGKAGEAAAAPAASAVALLLAATHLRVSAELVMKSRVASRVETEAR